MWYLIKSLFRYTFKNKLSMILLSVLLTISIFLLIALTMMSLNLQKSYNKIVNEGNLANIVINENYSTTVASNPDLTDEEAKATNEEEFKTWLSTQGVEYREFTSIDVTNTKDNKAIKVIEYDNNYTINKLVMSEGNNLYNDTFDFQTIIDAADWTSDTEDAIQARRMVVYLASKAYWTDSAFQNHFNVNAKQKLIDTNDKIGQDDYDPKNWTNENYYKFIRQWLDITIGDQYRPLLNKGYRLNFENWVSNGNPKVIGNITNHSSSFAITPTYVLKNQNKKVIPTNWYNEIKKYLTIENYLLQSEFEEKILAAIPDEYKIYVDNLPYIIVGAGITPDFMYPVFSYEKITPNTNEEIIIYTTHDGYKCCQNSYRSSPVDQYIVAKYNGNVDLMVKKINEILPLFMTTAGQTWAYTYDDTNNMFQPTGIRLAFLPRIVSIQTTISNVLFIFIVVLGIIIFVIMLKKFISDNQTSIAILRSNGYRKRDICWSTSLFSVIPCLIGGTVGFFLAQFTQSLLMNIYSSYWIVPISFTPFSPLIWLAAIAVPMLLFTIVAGVSCLLIVKKPPGQLMNESSKFTVSRISKFVIRPLPTINILSKFRLSIAFSSLSRLIVLTTMLTLMMTTLTFAFETSGKFEHAKTLTYVDKKYNMAFDLETPTVQGGQYFRTTFENVSKPIFDNNKNLLNYNGTLQGTSYAAVKGLNSNINKINNLNQYSQFWDYLDGDNANNLNVIGTYVNNHLPSANDAGWQKNNLNYLKNLSESQLFVDCELGGVNPWDIARSLAPENMQNYSNNAFREILQKAYDDPNVYFSEDVINNNFSNWNSNLINKMKNKTNKEILVTNKLLKPINKDDILATTIYLYDDESNQYFILEPEESILGIKASLKEVYIALFSYLMTLDNYKNIFYKVNYNYVAMNETAETYTYVNAKTKLNGDDVNIRIEGIKPNSSYLQLKNNHGENLNDLLWIDWCLEKNKTATEENVEGNDKNQIHEIYNEINQSNTYPLIINESAQYQYHLDIGDEIEIFPTNLSTRYNPQNKFDNSIESNTWKLKVVGIYQSVQNPEFYINQRVANKILKLDNERVLSYAFYDPNKQKGDVGYQIDPYNGFYTIEQNPQIITNCLTLYAINGLSPATDKFINTQSQQALINATLTGTNLYNKLAKRDLAVALGYYDPNTMEVLMEEFENDINNGTFNASKIIDFIIDTYGDDAYFSLIHNAQAITMYMEAFDNTSFLTNAILILLLTIISIISTLSTVTIAFDLLNSSLAIAAILKALGYSDKQNIISFTSILIPSLIVSFGLSMGLSFLLFKVFNKFVYSYSNILLSLNLTWWAPIVSLILMSLVIGIILVYAYKIFSKKQITESIQRY